MKVLHIAVGYNYSSLYKNMFSYLANEKISQVVYVPEHKKNQKNDNVEEVVKGQKIVRSQIISPLARIFYFIRMRKVTTDIFSKVDLEKITFVHAHSLFTDGISAYHIYKKYGIPYIVAIRDTDLNKYYKYRPYLKKYIYKVLENAEKIIFLSESYSEKLLNKYPTKKNLHKKIEILPNGIDDYWLKEGEVHPKTFNNRNLNLIFVGKIVKRKNLKKVIDVVKYLNEKVINTQLTIVGEGPLLESYKKENLKNPKIIFNGSENNKEKLKELYLKNDILVVPSYTETFGLVYPEAMSNGLPVIYTAGQGFDEQFKDGEVGYAVNPNSIYDISNSIEKILKNYDQISYNCLQNYTKFNWEEIVKRYIEIYNGHF